MVKGVNKTIIEVNNTGSRFFEKIVFYVTPEYGNLNARQLKNAATNFLFNFEDKKPARNLRKRIKYKRLGLLLCLLSAVVVIFSIVLVFVL